MKEGDLEHHIDFRRTPPDRPTQVETDVYFGMVEREVLFEAGQPIVFSPDDVLEICLNYNTIADVIALALVEHLRSLGIVETPTAEPITPPA